MVATTTAILLAAAWVLLAIRGIRGMRRVPDLAALPAWEQPAGDGGANPPLLTVVVAARNEEKAIGGCLDSLLAQDYPALEIIVVDDRSTDATGSIADAAAQRGGGRLKVIHVEECPPDWLGKCHAMSLGSAEASGEFILFTDGDVRFEATAISRAVRHMVDERADMVVVFPDVITHSAGEGVLVQVFAQCLAAAYPPWKAMCRRSKGFTGVGAFNMVRRSLYERCGGHRFLRMQVIDDVGLGRIIKYAGGRIRVAVGRDMVHIRWQDSLGGTIRGLEKNAFAAMRYSVPRTLAAVSGLLFVYLWPWFGMAVGPLPARLICAGVALVVQPWVGWNTIRLMRTRALLAFGLPVGAVLFAWTILRSMVVTLRQGGIRWRDSFYRLSDLRQFRL